MERSIKVASRSVNRRSRSAPRGSGQWHRGDDARPATLGRRASSGVVVRWDARQAEAEKSSYTFLSSSRPRPLLSCDAKAAILDVARPASSWPRGAHGARLWRDVPLLLMPCAASILQVWRVAYQLERLRLRGAWLPRRVTVPPDGSCRRHHVPSMRMSSESYSFRPCRASFAELARGRSREQRRQQSPRIDRKRLRVVPGSAGRSSDCDEHQPSPRQLS
jgi:hypothetical protein